MAAMGYGASMLAIVILVFTKYLLQLAGERIIEMKALVIPVG